jgi:hypothetical protein
MQITNHHQRRHKQLSDSCSQQQRTKKRKQNKKKICKQLSQAYGNSSVLRVEKIDKPKVADHEILIHRLHASVNPVDLKFVRDMDFSKRTIIPVGTSLEPVLHPRKWTKRARAFFRTRASLDMPADASHGGRREDRRPHWNVC